MIRIENYDDLLKVIIESMELRGVTQKELAQALGVLQPQINRVLKHKNSPSIDLVFRICTYLKVTVAAATPQIEVKQTEVD